MRWPGGEEKQPRDRRQEEAEEELAGPWALACRGRGLQSGRGGGLRCWPCPPPPGTGPGLWQDTWACSGLGDPFPLKDGAKVAAPELRFPQGQFTSSASVSRVPAGHLAQKQEWVPLGAGGLEGKQQRLRHRCLWARREVTRAPRSCREEGELGSSGRPHSGWHLEHGVQARALGWASPGLMWRGPQQGHVQELEEG